MESTSLLEFGFKAVLNRADVFDHIIVFAVAHIGYPIVNPESRGPGKSEHISVTDPETLGDFGDAAIHGHVNGSVCIIDTKPEYAADGVR